MPKGVRDGLCLAGGKHELGVIKRNCRECNRVESARYRQTSSGIQKTRQGAKNQRQNKKMRSAHASVRRAVKSGRLLPAREFKCSDCPAPAVCYDHRDYMKPLEVEPVCGACNFRRGKANG